jgi:hypothetical protein
MCSRRALSERMASARAWADGAASLCLAFAVAKHASTQGKHPLSLQPTHLPPTHSRAHPPYPPSPRLQVLVSKEEGNIVARPDASAAARAEREAEAAAKAGAGAVRAT